MQPTRIIIATVALAVLAACGSSDGGKSEGAVDPTPATTQASKSAPAPMDPTKVEKGIIQDFTHEPVNAKSVTCPDDMIATLGYEWTCDVEFTNGEYGNATIRIMDDKGGFRTISYGRSLTAPPGE